MEYSDQNGLLSYCYPPSLAVKPVFKTNLMSLKLHRVRHRVLFLKYNTLIWNSSLPEITLSSFDFARKGTLNKEFSDLPADSDAQADQRLPFSHKQSANSEESIQWHLQTEVTLGICTGWSESSLISYSIRGIFPMHDPWFFTLGNILKRSAKYVGIS